MKTVTVDRVLAWRPCGWDGDGYNRARIEALFAGRAELTPLDVLALDIPAKDRIWAVCHMLTLAGVRWFACDCAERVLERERAAGGEPDERSWAAVAVARRYAQGQATGEELWRAWAAASAAVATAAAVAARATAAAARVAWAVAADAAADAVDAGWAARTAADERQWQVARLREYARQEDM